jgi:hypothetical protein
MTRVREVELFIAPAANTMDRYTTRVTLPAAPWEQGEDFAALRQKRAAARDPWAHLAVKVAGSCGAPGCGRKLKRENTTGVCALHPHFKGVCRCVNCTKLAARRAKA